MPTTWGDIKTEVEDENDLAEETFVDAAELLIYANEAVRDIEKEIHKLHDKYFAAETSLPLSVGSDDLALPDDIYANKINALIYNDGSDKYEVKPLKNLRDIPDINDNDQYQYRIVNTVGGGRRIKLYPPSRVSDSTALTAYYRRQALPFLDESSVLDIPEAGDFIKQYVTDKVSNKERMQLDAPESVALKRKRTLLLESLQQMIDDDNTDVNVDMSYYGEFN